MLRKLTAEFIGTMFFLAIVVGSGIMGTNLANGNPGLELLANSISTGLGLIVLIWVLGPISGAHLNPLVSIAEFLDKKYSLKDALSYSLAQITGAIFGVVFAHEMFEQPLLSFSSRERSGFSQLFSEFIATFGLFLVIRGTQGSRRELGALAIGFYITSAYWFTASTSFANPAVTIARTFTDSFAGINPKNIAGFILAQTMGAASAWTISNWLFQKETSK